MFRGNKMNHDCWAGFEGLRVGVFGAFSLLLAGCGHVPLWENLPVLVQTNNAYDLEVIDTYNEIFGQDIFVAGDSGVPITRAELPQGVLGRADVHCGISGIERAEITISPLVRSKRVYQYTLAHELGHVLGLVDHLPEGLMQERAEPMTESLAHHFDGHFVLWVKNSYRLAPVFDENELEPSTVLVAAPSF